MQEVDEGLDAGGQRAGCRRSMNGIYKKKIENKRNT